MRAPRRGSDYIGTVWWLVTLGAAVLVLSLASAWLMGAEWGDSGIPDPIRRFLGMTPK